MRFLCDRQEKHRRDRLTNIPWKIVGIRHYTNHFVLSGILWSALPKMLSDRIFVLEIAIRKRLVDHRHTLCAHGILCRHLPPADDPLAYRSEIARANAVDIGHINFVRPRRSLTGHEDGSSPPVAAHRRV